MFRRLFFLSAFLLAAVFSVALPTSSPASDYATGFVNSDGYTWHDGYWWYGSNAYTRVWVAPTAGYWRCGIYYPGATGYWSYYFDHAGQLAATTYSALSYTDPAWRSKILDLAAQRDKYELDARRTSVEQAAFERSIAALGLTGNFAIAGYGQAVAYPALGAFANSHALYGNGYGATPNLGTYGANADSLYGYSFSQVKEAYGTTDLNALYQSASRLAKGAQDLGGQATSDFSALVEQAGNNQARVAEILAKAQAAAIALNAANPQPSTKTTTTSTVTGSAANVGTAGSTVQTTVAPGTTPPPDPQAAAAASQADMANFMRTVAIPSCGSCHSGKTVKGGFDIMSYPTLDATAKAKVWGRVFSLDPEKRMPRAADGGPGVPQTAEQKQEWVKH